jgi:acyl-CoA reductase-like NAD-dependent aldehyde dehydrogenase
VQMLTDRAAKLRLGPGLDDKTDVGPLIHEEARQKVAEYVDIAKKEGASVVLGGRIPQGDKRLECGWFYEPTVLTGVKPGMRVEQEEIFGPVLAVLKAKDLTEAIRINNDVKYGLSSSLYTRDINGAFQAMTDLDTGITYVNAPTIGAEAHFAVRRGQADGQRAPGGGVGGLRLLLRDESGVRGLLGTSAAGATRHIHRIAVAPERRTSLTAAHATA